MEIKQTTNKNMNIISSYTHSSITVGNTEYKESIIVSKNNVETLNINKISLLDINNLTEIDQHEIIIFGTGSKIEKLTAEHLKYLAATKIGFEFMRTESAIKTYNTLAHDNREVMAILLIN